MGIRFYCPNGHKLNVKQFQAGKKAICPFCGAKIQIPLESTRPSSKASKGHNAPGEVAGGHADQVEPNPPPPLPGQPPGWPAASAPPGTPATALLASLPAPEAAGSTGPPAATSLSDVPPAMPLSPESLSAGRAVVTSVAGAPPPVAAPGSAQAAGAPATPQPGAPVARFDEVAPLPALALDKILAAESPPPAPGPGLQEPVDPIAEAPEMIWYVRPPSGGQYGPASGVIMRTWMAEGRVSADSLIWREGWRDWQEAGKVFPQLQGNDFMQFLDSARAGALEPVPTTAPYFGKRSRSADGLSWLLLAVSFVVIILFSLLLWVLLR